MITTNLKWGFAYGHVIVGHESFEDLLGLVVESLLERVHLVNVNGRHGLGVFVDGFCKGGGWIHK